MIGTTQFIKIEAAKKMMVAAEAEASANDWNVAVTIVDAASNLLMFQKMDGTQVGSIDVSIGKAKTALKFKRSTKLMEEMVNGGRVGFLSIDGIVPVQGGLPIVVDSEVIGAVGVSGATSSQDEQIALAAIGVLEDFIESQ